MSSEDGQNMRLLPLPVCVSLLLLYWTLPAEAAEMWLEPDVQTVLHGEDTRFTCTTRRPQWGAMIWQLNGKTVLTISQLSGVVPSTNPNITAEKTSSADGWVLVLKNTQRQHEGEVTCDLQEVEKKTAQLFVQERGRVSLQGPSMALRGHTVEFVCQAEGWYPLPTLHWHLNDKQVNRDMYNFSSGLTEGLYSISSNLSVTASSSSELVCSLSVSAMTLPLSSTARLTVVAEVLDEGDSSTVGLAVLGSLCALLLLALLLLCTLLYRNKTREVAQQQATRFVQSECRSTSVAGVTQGMVNLGYTNDREVYLSELFTGAPNPFTAFTVDQVPDVVSSSSQSFHSDSQDQEISKNIRSITTV